MADEWAFPEEMPDFTDVRNRYNYKQFSDKHFRYEVKRYPGYAVIFNNTTFDHSRFVERTQSHHDVDSLKSTLIDHLTFRPSDVDVLHNKTTEQMTRILEQVARRDFSEHTCLIVVVLSYGDFKDGEAKCVVHGTNGPFTYQQLLSPFKYGKVPSLVDTPKFFIIQSERSPDDEFNHSHPVPPPLSSSTDVSDPDTLFVYSVDPRHLVWRKDGKGSWFIQRLCEVLLADGFVLDITQIFTRTLRLVRIDYEGFVRSTINCKILGPRMLSLLSKEFKFDWDY